jgi:hypothetical protein
VNIALSAVLPLLTHIAQSNLASVLKRKGASLALVLPLQIAWFILASMVNIALLAVLPLAHIARSNLASILKRKGAGTGTSIANHSLDPRFHGEHCPVGGTSIDD